MERGLDALQEKPFQEFDSEEDWEEDDDDDVIPQSEDGGGEANEVDDVEYAKAMAKRLKIPFVDPTSARIDPSAVAMLKKDTAYKLQAVPVRVVYDTLLVAMADPENTSNID